MKLRDFTFKTVFAFLVATGVLALVDIPMGSATIDLVSAYDIDEVGGVGHMLQNLAGGDYDLHGLYEHGSVYPYLGLTVVKFFRGIGYIPEYSLIVIVMRLISLASFALVLVGTYRIARLVIRSKALALAAVFGLACTPDLFYYAQGMHPDLTQVAFLVLSALYVFRRQTRASMRVAAAICGIAAAAKMGAIYFLPFIWLIVAIKETNGQRVSRVTLYRIFGDGLACLLFFIAAFFVVNPYAFLHFGDFVNKMIEIQQVVATGWGKVASPAPWRWFAVFYGQYAATVSLLLVASFIFLVATVVAGFCRYSRLADSVERIRFVMGLYVVLSLLQIVLVIRMREVRYVYQVLPFLWVGLALFCEWLLDRLKFSFSQKNLAVLGLVVLLIFRWTAMAEATAWLGNRNVSDTVRASEWVVENFSPNVPVVGEWYTYADPRLTNFSRVLPFGTNIIANAHDNHARLVMLSKNGSGRYVWKQPKTRFADLKWTIDEEFSATNDFRRWLLSIVDGTSDWTIAFENNDILVLQRHE